ncbi:hypothetical protein TNIN_313241 [Trichonephila inaurata madagascariensis]|uniref:Uncharacterized protein n=1 Tax=Trichonephila inaurata madagascariensis TaxID=2747483 RepID=A0A8X6YPB8_9ARAC|nr:hypothetical protein TNIN_313241 [Trichonephila inaurata madagascariensis]
MRRSSCRLPSSVSVLTKVLNSSHSVILEGIFSYKSNPSPNKASLISEDKSGDILNCATPYARLQRSWDRLIWNFGK